MIIVIQCASKKWTNAGFLRLQNGLPVMFVADPTNAPPSKDCVYARPDDPSESGASWRDVLIEYNKAPGSNPLGLYRAFELYENKTYERLAKFCGLENTYILSAGWGLITGEFLTPKYDITFSPSAEPYKRRRKVDTYRDCCMLVDQPMEEIFFFGGKDYVPLFCELTRSSGVRGRCFVIRAHLRMHRAARSKDSRLQRGPIGTTNVRMHL